MRKVLGVGVLIVIVVGFKLAGRNSDEKEVLSDMKGLIGRVASSREETAYLNRILEREHSEAFEAACSMGGRRRAATLDESRYASAVLGAMISECEKDKKTELAGKLRSVLEAVSSPQG